MSFAPFYFTQETLDYAREKLNHCNAHNQKKMFIQMQSSNNIHYHNCNSRHLRSKTLSDSYFRAYLHIFYQITKKSLKTNYVSLLPPYEMEI